MPVYKAPTRDTRFVLNEVLKLEQYAALPSFENTSADMVDTIVEESGKFVAEVLAPLNLSGDQQG
ncbi:MAG: acyl-CoA dehydrogenase, partial [Sphingomonadaceae bacterium]|nr:acyl-CoA dehydrogenase [Sphingomonadaceae bacterium]